MSLIKMIYVAGDSFSFGQELGGSDVPPCDFYKLTDYMRDNSYTGIIAKNWGVDTVINKSLPGGSNDRIYRMITTDLPTYFGQYRPEEIFVFISLTHASRREFYEREHERWCALITNFCPDETDNKSYKEFWKLYSTYFDDPKEYTPRFIGQILGMQSFLKGLGIRYLMSDSMYHEKELWDIYRAMDPNVIHQIDTVRYHMEEPFNGFVGRRKLSFGKYHHPLEEGHLAWANHLMGYMYNKGINPK